MRCRNRWHLVVIIGQRLSRQIAPRLLTVPNTHSFGDLLHQNILLQQLLPKRVTTDFQTFTVLQHCHEPDTHAQLPGSGVPIGRYFISARFNVSTNQINSTTATGMKAVAVSTVDFLAAADNSGSTNTATLGIFSVTLFCPLATHFAKSGSYNCPAIKSAKQ